jgi:hypothetical protein
MEQKNELFKVAEVQLTYNPKFKAVDRLRSRKHMMLIQSYWTVGIMTRFH